MKKIKLIGIILTILIIITILTMFVIYNFKYKKESNEAVNKAKEEFILDYNEEIIITSVECFNNNDYIITIYGEEHYGVYLYKNGEIWNYINESN